MSVNPAEVLAENHRTWRCDKALHGGLAKNETAITQGGFVPGGFESNTGRPAVYFSPVNSHGQEP